MTDLEQMKAMLLEARILYNEEEFEIKKGSKIVTDSNGLATGLQVEYDTGTRLEMGDSTGPTNGGFSIFTFDSNGKLLKVGMYVASDSY